MAKSQVERNRALKRANHRRGLRLVQVWVPQYRVHEVYEQAAAWRAQHAEINAEAEWIGDSKKSIDKEVYK